MVKYRRQEMPDIRKSGKKTVTYRFEANHNMDENAFLTRAQSYNPAMTVANLECALDTVADAMAKLMGLGYSVTLKGIGTFTPQLGLKGQTNSVIPEHMLEKGYVESPCVRGINFKACSKLIRETDKECDFEQGSTSHLRHSKYTIEKRAERARQYMKTHNGRMYVQEYANLNGMSHSTAVRELRQLANDADSGIGREGHGSHVIYILI